MSFSSSCRRFISLPKSPPCLQRILPRVGDNVIRLITRESHECCVHLLQHELQVLHPSVLVRLRRLNSRSIAVVVISVGCSAAHSNIISDSLITPAKNASVFFDHCWKSFSPRPCTSIRLGVSFRTWAVARLLLALHRQVQVLLPLDHGERIVLVEVVSQHAPSSSTSLLLRIRFCNFSSCVFTAQPANTAHQASSQLRAHRQAVHHTNDESSNDHSALPGRNQLPRCQASTNVTQP